MLHFPFQKWWGYDIDCVWAQAGMLREDRRRKVTREKGEHTVMRMGVERKNRELPPNKRNSTDVWGGACFTSAPAVSSYSPQMKTPQDPKRWHLLWCPRAVLLKQSPLPTCLSVSQALVKNTCSWAPPQVSWSRVPGNGTLISAFLTTIFDVY